jgi:hypothetical protein
MVSNGKPPSCLNTTRTTTIFNPNLIFRCRAAASLDPPLTPPCNNPPPPHAQSTPLNRPPTLSSLGPLQTTLHLPPKELCPDLQLSVSALTALFGRTYGTANRDVGHGAILIVSGKNSSRHGLRAGQRYG